ncbi:GNAT family N-acetyltransferase [Methanogenium sp. S4BF]|uniref:GNAT family N-acetyltransferase n=1 Tax=Methanogenium sp. S4BF TaxID=1789226 RepID=UPI002416ADE8|nr:GNAT family N-acetyltransferase [Methanogenium sp. S4BF]WFN35328.1 GNAT family N-acetyltransferase [Methanogenium sp. S4BF]
MGKSTIEARVLEESEYSVWDELVENSVQGTIFHTSDWLGLCSESFKAEPKIFGCFNDKNELMCGCSLFIYKSKGIFKNAISTSVMTPYGGFVLRPSNSTKIRKMEEDYFLCIHSLEKLIRNQKYLSTIITNSPDILDVRPLTWNRWISRVFYTYYLDLNSFDLNNASREIKREITRATKSGISLQSIRNAEIHNTLFQKVFERQNLLPPADITAFNKVIEHINRNKIGDMWIAKNQYDEIIGSQIWLWDTKRAYIWSVASDPDFRNSGVNIFSVYTILQELCSKGFGEVNMMQGNIPNLAEFAAKFNPKLVPYYSVENYSSIIELAMKIRRKF